MRERRFCATCCCGEQSPVLVPSLGRSVSSVINACPILTTTSLYSDSFHTKQRFLQKSTLVTRIKLETQLRLELCPISLCMVLSRSRLSVSVLRLMAASPTSHHPNHSHQHYLYAISPVQQYEPLVLPAAFDPTATADLHRLKSAPRRHRQRLATVSTLDRTSIPARPR